MKNVRVFFEVDNFTKAKLYNNDMTQRKLKYIQYVLVTLGLLGLVDLLTVSAASDIVREAYNLEVENWGIVTAILFEIGLKFGIPDVTTLIGGFLHTSWFALLIFGFLVRKERKKLSVNVKETPVNEREPANNNLIIFIAVMIGVGLVISAFIISKS
jgi:hypothetical protein